MLQAAASFSANLRSATLSATSLVTAFVLYLAGVSALLYYSSTIVNYFQTLGYGLMWLCVLIPVPIIMTYYWLPRKRRWDLSQRPPIGAASSQTPTLDYFRLRPYEAGDKGIFSRMDREHIKTFEWIRSTSHSILYLTGQSGTGKTSLLEAYVLPRVRSESPVLKIIEVHAADNPVIALHDQVTKLNQQCDKQDGHESTQDLMDLLSEGDGSLIIFDQFENFIINGQEQWHSFTDFIDEARRYENITCLIIMRSDYVGLLCELRIPMPNLGQNWKEIGLFTDRAAYAFFKNAKIGLDDEFIGELLEGASRLERNTGLYRPITLNMIGVLVSRFGTALPAAFDPTELIQNYLKESVLETRAAPAVLRSMLGRRGMKVQVEVEALARELQMHVYAVRECLFRLETKGLVRALDDERAVWEISHDFVAQELRGIVARIKPSLFKSLFPVGIAVSFVIWCMVVVAAPKYLEMMSGAVSEARSVGEGYIAEHKEVIRADVLAMAGDLNREAVALRGNSERFQRVLESQALLRSLAEAVVFQSNGEILARAGMSFLLEVERLPPVVLEQAAAGKVVVLTGDAGDRVRAVVRLQNFADAFLFVGRLVDPALLASAARVHQRFAELEWARENWTYIYYAAAAVYLIAILLQGVAFMRVRDYKA